MGGDYVDLHQYAEVQVLHTSTLPIALLVTVSAFVGTLYIRLITLELVASSSYP